MTTKKTQKNQKNIYRAVVNNILYSAACYENENGRRVIVCEDVHHSPVKGYFDEDRMGYYTSDGHQVFIEGCGKFQMFVEYGWQIQE